MDRNKLAKEIHQTAKEKGWWDEERNHNEMFMLIITELAEAIEADRKEAWLSVGNFEDYEQAQAEGAAPMAQVFEANIKDTVEDEIADAYIRCLDYLHYKLGDNILFYELEFKDWGDNFAENIFNICGIVCHRDIKYAVSAIESLCDFEEIDLEWHVEEKMRYNAQREHKHGGKKY